jgi:hypothetical protein
MAGHTQAVLIDLAASSSICAPAHLQNGRRPRLTMSRLERPLLAKTIALTGDIALRQDLSCSATRIVFLFL